MALNYDEYGHVVLQGTFAIDQVTRGSHFNIHFVEESLYLQPVRFYRAEAQVDHFRPCLTINVLSRTFIHNSLRDQQKLAVECTGAHLGNIQLETHWQSSLNNVKQPLSHLHARAHYFEDGMEIHFGGELLPPPHLPKDLSDDGRPLPESWPTHFQVDSWIPWEAIPYLLGHPGHYHGSGNGCSMGPSERNA
jgi:hypothetical protein